MDYEFFVGFTPRIIDVVQRDRQFWEPIDYVLLRERTGLHTLTYVVEGEGMLELAGQLSLLEAGRLFQIWPNQYMRITTTAERPVRFISIQFRYGLVRWEGDRMESRETVHPLPLPEQLVLQESSGIAELFARAFRHWTEKSGDYEWLVKLELLQAIQLINRSVQFSMEKIPHHDTIQKSIDYMKTHFQSPISREMIASHVSLSPGYFSVSFKKNTGLSPIQYLTKLRLDHAKYLLRSSRIPIKRVAEESGFEDSFYFSRLFFRETGMTPRDYRNS
ncbi:AraC-like ligand binding domain-containing protein [Paenibacillus sp. UNCCL117]|uniref:helix-turn-helix domain-containing protein n=1 Tax=unclassified Paenibacillus TaxID=185978 RepID=UPI00088F6F1F|nr:MULTISPECIES: AraC family transcriptional regulator [unclassified Paenibacillus]SDE19330.1 AraC-like ligand binding domain-containing protein [Paenibacillus sp. cl123]SFW62034.1 AraC-like ligand binding domain-containing protein [Paenibacillus sp. UNCCL117]